MLLLVRNTGEKIIVNDNIVIEVLDISGSKVKLAINAPDNVLIDRSEIREQRKYHENGSLQTFKELHKR